MHIEAFKDVFRKFRGPIRAYHVSDKSMQKLLGNELAIANPIHESHVLPCQPCWQQAPTMPCVNIAFVLLFLHSTSSKSHLHQTKACHMTLTKIRKPYQRSVSLFLICKCLTCILNTQSRSNIWISLFTMAISHSTCVHIYIYPCFYWSNGLEMFLHILLGYLSISTPFLRYWRLDREKNSLYNNRSSRERVNT